jgi:hypothetical protein
MAERFGLPVVTLVDTPGRIRGSAPRARQAGRSRAIETCLQIGVPVAAIIGGGGSGGAVALAVADRVLMLEHAVYSVISPEAAPRFVAQRQASGGRGDAADRQDLPAGRGRPDHSEPLGSAHQAPTGRSRQGRRRLRAGSRAAPCAHPVPSCAAAAGRSSSAWATAPRSDRPPCAVCRWARRRSDQIQ